MDSDKESTLSELRGKIWQFIEDREWNGNQSPKDLAISISLEASELLEQFQWIKDKQVDELLKNPEKSGNIRDELADIVIYCLTFAHVLDIDVSQAVLDKIEKNAAHYPIDRTRGKYQKYTEFT